MGWDLAGRRWKKREGGGREAERDHFREKVGRQPETRVGRADTVRGTFQLVSLTSPRGEPFRGLGLQRERKKRAVGRPSSKGGGARVQKEGRKEERKRERERERESERESE